VQAVVRCPRRLLRRRSRKLNFDGHAQQLIHPLQVAVADLDVLLNCSSDRSGITGTEGGLPCCRKNFSRRQAKSIRATAFGGDEIDATPAPVGLGYRMRTCWAPETALRLPAFGFHWRAFARKKLGTALQRTE